MSNDIRPLGDVANKLLFENELVRVWEMNLAPGERSDRHRHDLPYLLCVLEGSRVDADVEGRGPVEIPVQSGSVFFVPPGGRTSPRGLAFTAAALYVPPVTISTVPVTNELARLAR